MIAKPRVRVGQSNWTRVNFPFNPIAIVRLLEKLTQLQRLQDRGTSPNSPSSNVGKGFQRRRVWTGGRVVGEMGEFVEWRCSAPGLGDLANGAVWRKVVVGTSRGEAVANPSISLA